MSTNVPIVESVLNSFVPSLKLIFLLSAFIVMEGKLLVYLQHAMREQQEKQPPASLLEVVRVVVENIVLPAVIDQTG